jgi:hypothetical protein
MGVVNQMYRDVITEATLVNNENEVENSLYSRMYNYNDSFNSYNEVNNNKEEFKNEKC